MKFSHLSNVLPLVIRSLAQPLANVSRTVSAPGKPFESLPHIIFDGLHYTGIYWPDDHSLEVSAREFLGEAEFAKDPMDAIQPGLAYLYDGTLDSEVLTLSIAAFQNVIQWNDISGPLLNIHRLLSSDWLHVGNSPAILSVHRDLNPSERSNILTVSVLKSLGVTHETSIGDAIEAEGEFYPDRPIDFAIGRRCLNEFIFHLRSRLRNGQVNFDNFKFEWTTDHVTLSGEDHNNPTLRPVRTEDMISLLSNIRDFYMNDRRAFYGFGYHLTAPTHNEHDELIASLHMDQYWGPWEWLQVNGSAASPNRSISGGVAFHHVGANGSSLKNDRITSTTWFANSSRATSLSSNESLLVF